MRKLLIPLIITLLSLISNNTFAWTGAGTSASPYHISTKAHLIALADSVNNGTRTYSGKFFIMDNYVDMSVSGTFNPIGNASNRTFQGNFNGNGKKIKNLTLNSGNYVGLFGNTFNAIIYNLGIENFTITTSNSISYGGSLVGYAKGSTISKCYAIGSITGRKDCRIGGLIGDANNNSSINNCYSIASIINNGNNGTRYYGGLVGYIEINSTISNCYSAPISIPSDGDYIGLLVGNNNNSTINDSYYDNTLLSNVNNYDGDSRSSNEMKSGCFATTLNNSQNPIVWFKAKSQINQGYPVLSWQMLSDNVTPAGFEGNCLGVTTFDGGQAIPYQVMSVKDLIYISNMVANDTTYIDKYFIVTQDIANFNNFTPIGNSTISFQGNFNGQGHTLSSLNTLSTTYGGLFGYISGATIYNLGIQSGNISCSNGGYSGAIVGYAINSSIYSCYSNVNMSGNTNCRLGGLIGNANGCTINNCYYSGGNINYSGSNGYYGGLIGYIESSSNISNSYSAPSNFPNQPTRTGPLYGYFDNSTSNINNSYSLHSSNWADQQYVNARNLTDMQTPQFAKDLNACQTQTWRSLVNNYPVLYWQGTGTDIPSCFDGSGTEVDPFRIRYAKDLVILSNSVAGGSTYSGQYLLVENNINFLGTIDTSTLFNPIGNRNYAFQGNFNGNGKVISNLTITSPSTPTTLQDIGLFGKVENNATIKNLGIVGANITLSASSGSNYHAAGLVAHIGDNSTLCTISGCYVSSSTIKGYGTRSTIAGLVGYAGHTKIENCYARANIIQGDYATQNNNGSNYYGGLVGYINLNTTISNSYSSPLSFSSRTAEKGLLVGVCDNSNSFPNSYYDNTISVNGYNDRGTPMTYAQMQNPQFAIDLNVSCQNHNWKHDDVSPLVNGGFPILYWQIGGSTLPPCFDGSGTTEDDPFRIRCVADLVRLSNLVAGGSTYSGQYLRVENNIDFNTDPTNTGDFSPIGDATNSFQGNFSGRGHVISNLTLNSGTYVGLFGYILNATIDSIGIENFTLKSSNYLGGIVGYASGSNIRRCYSLSLLTGSWNNSDIYIGGLIGYSDNCTINNCYSRATINCTYSNYYWNYSGGLIGDIENGSISNSYSAPVSISYGDRGGLLVGKNSSGLDFTTSYCLDIAIHQSPNGYYGSQNNSGIEKGSNEMRSGCFPVTLNGTQPSIIWYKAKSESVSGITDGVNKGYPVLSWQKITLSGGVIIPAGFEGNCLGYDTPFVGSPSSPYKVQYVKDLIYISNMVANDTTYYDLDNNVHANVKKYFQVQNDISFIKYDNVNSVLVDSSNLYVPIGDFTNSKPFSGNFSGQRYAIANYSFSDTTKDNIGLFGYIKKATIQKLGISNISIKAGNNVGGLVGNMDANSTIDACFVYGYINGVSNVGGLAGTVTTASCNILQSFTNTTIDALTNVGGLVGSHGGGAISDSYSNSEIYSSTVGNDKVGGIIGLASSASNLSKVYSACKIIRNGTTNTNTYFGKIIGKGALTLDNTCFSRDNVFVNCDNITTSGLNGVSKTNAELRDHAFVAILNGSNSFWKHDYNIYDNPTFPDSINDGYPILKYQTNAIVPASSGLWPTTTASQVVIIKNQVQLKTNATNYPKCAYVKIQNGGLLLNNTNINLYGEYNRELFVGKWNLIGLSTYNRILSCLYNYTDSISFKTFVKKFDYRTNNWQASTNPNTNTVININTPFNYNEGFLVMPNYSLDSRQLTKSRIVSKGVLYNENASSYIFNNTSPATHKLVSLANNYPDTLSSSSFVLDNSANIQDEIRNGIQGRFIYVYDADNGNWNTNNQSINPVTSIKPSEGFFIFTNSASDTLSFAKSQLNTSGAKNIIKSDLIYVKASANNQERESFLEFNDDADNGFDFNDGLMLFGSNYNAVEPFFKIPTQEINDSTTQLIKDAFSSLPYSTELDLRSQDNNDVSLEFSNIPSGIYVYLIDSLLSKVQCLNENPYYNIKVSEGNNGNRLTVLFTYNKSDAKGFFNNNSNEEIRIWNNNKDLNIEGVDLVRYEIYDIMGNKLLEQGISSNNYQTLLNLKTGVYIVRASSKTGLKSQKISVVSE